jgi:hypothetical protein
VQRAYDVQTVRCVGSQRDGGVVGLACMMALWWWSFGLGGPRVADQRFPYHVTIQQRNQISHLQYLVRPSSRPVRPRLTSQMLPFFRNLSYLNYLSIFSLAAV